MDGTVLMPRYQVTAWVGTLTAEVEAENEDDAMPAAEIQSLLAGRGPIGRGAGHGRNRKVVTVSERRTVEVTVPVAEGVNVYMSRELDAFYVRIGAWYVALEGGDLVVREYASAINASVLVKVPA